MRIVVTPKGWRFELAYRPTGVAISWCRVEILREVGGRPVVILTETPESRGRSLMNAIEEVCERVTTGYLRPLGIHVEDVRWLQHDIEDGGDEDWYEVAIKYIAKGKGPRFRDPHWEETAPLIVDWDDPGTATFAARRVRQLGPTDVEAFAFDAGECHRVRTGICSLEGERVDDDEGESGYDYCRQLGDVASLMDYVRQCAGGELPREPVAVRRIAQDPAVLARVDAEWTPPFGSVPADLGKAIRTALATYGARGQIEGLMDGGKVGLVDGRHRCCVAFRQGISVDAVVETEEHRKGTDISL